jgi:hypothetical protein
VTRHCWVVEMATATEVAVAGENRGEKAVAMTSVDTAVSPPRRRKRGPKPPRHVFDRRTRVGRRSVELAKAFRERLGGSDPVMLAMIEKAARLVALSEDASARALNADPRVDMDTLVRLNRLADLALRRLHLDRYRPAPPAQPSLSQYLGQRNDNAGG